MKLSCVGKVGVDHIRRDADNATGCRQDVLPDTGLLLLFFEPAFAPPQHKALIDIVNYEMACGFLIITFFKQAVIVSVGMAGMACNSLPDAD
jgi:hypothetical protein